jgi:hypothetical protein
MAVIKGSGINIAVFTFAKKNIHSNPQDSSTA